ncbi:hypothetical protein ABR738_03615 [Streptomyces sp. Edi4]|uniref:hypothetical protein n=1 Tax=Streptomyces sp. Edi4 TaxID=3162527 RepID=UPI003305B82C
MAAPSIPARTAAPGGCDAGSSPTRPSTSSPRISRRPSGPGEECLLFVHFRQVVGQIRYRFCESCAHGMITDVVIDERFHDTGLGTRALSHLSSRHPGAVWSSASRTWSTGGTRDLLHRMRVPATAADTPCSHIHAPLSHPAHTTA